MTPITPYPTGTSVPEVFKPTKAYSEKYQNLSIPKAKELGFDTYKLFFTAAVDKSLNIKNLEQLQIFFEKIENYPNKIDLFKEILRKSKNLSSSGSSAIRGKSVNAVYEATITAIKNLTMERIKRNLALARTIPEYYAVARGIVKQTDLPTPQQDVWDNLIDNGYITEAGVITEKFCTLSDASGMITSNDFIQNKEAIFNILKNSQDKAADNALNDLNTKATIVCWKAEIYDQIIRDLDFLTRNETKIAEQETKTGRIYHGWNLDVNMDRDKDDTEIPTEFYTIVKRKRSALKGAFSEVVDPNKKILLQATQAFRTDNDNVKGLDFFLKIVGRNRFLKYTHYIKQNKNREMYFKNINHLNTPFDPVIHQILLDKAKKVLAKMKAANWQDMSPICILYLNAICGVEKKLEELTSADSPRNYIYKEPNNIAECIIAIKQLHKTEAIDNAPYLNDRNNYDKADMRRKEKDKQLFYMMDLDPATSSSGGGASINNQNKSSSYVAQALKEIRQIQDTYNHENNLRTQTLSDIKKSKSYDCEDLTALLLNKFKAKEIPARQINFQQGELKHSVCVFQDTNEEWRMIDGSRLKKNKANTPEKLLAAVYGEVDKVYVIEKSGKEEIGLDVAAADTSLTEKEKLGLLRYYALVAFAMFVANDVKDPYLDGIKRYISGMEKFVPSIKNIALYNAFAKIIDIDITEECKSCSDQSIIHLSLHKDSAIIYFKNGKAIKYNNISFNTTENKLKISNDISITINPHKKQLIEDIKEQLDLKKELPAQNKYSARFYRIIYEEILNIPKDQTYYEALANLDLGYIPEEKDRKINKEISVYFRNKLIPLDLGKNILGGINSRTKQFMVADSTGITQGSGKPAAIFYQIYKLIYLIHEDGINKSDKLFKNDLYKNVGISRKAAKKVKLEIALAKCEYVDKTTDKEYLKLMLQQAIYDLGQSDTKCKKTLVRLLRKNWPAGPEGIDLNKFFSRLK